MGFLRVYTDARKSSFPPRHTFKVTKAQELLPINASAHRRRVVVRVEEFLLSFPHVAPWAAHTARVAFGLSGAAVKARCK